VPDRDLREEELVARLTWFIEMRWLFILGLLLVVLIDTYVWHVALHAQAIALTTLVVAAYNSVFWLRHRLHPKRPRPSLTQSRVEAMGQIYLDTVALTVLIHFFGGVESPFLFFYLFHAIVGSILLSRAEAVLLGFIACCLFVLVAGLESYAILPHYQLGDLLSKSNYQNPAHIGVVTISLAASLFLAIYMTSSIVEGLHSRQRELVVTQRVLKERSEEMGKSERLAMIGRLAAGVAHEINNPLGGIMLFANLVLRKAPLAGIERENLERICDEANRCQKIVQGLLDFARHREPKAEPVDIRDVLDKALGLVEHQAMFQNIEMLKDYQKNGCLARVDPAQMEQVFINLVLNAVEAMDHKGMLTISVRSVDEGQAIQISVADTGCGISEEHIDRVFDPFFTTKSVGEGTGLGLSVSRGIVENHGGTIWVTRTGGQGTTFCIRLPAIQGGT
jgi:signal transduction histidine kinase